MTFLSARRLVPACVLSAAAVVALAAPGAASASLGVQCSGSNITGKGSSLQKLAQEVWDAGFNTSAAKPACNGTQGSKALPTITYSPEGSGAGLEAWGVNGHAFEGGTIAFVGTDEAPNSKQKEEIEKNGEAGTLLTIPVLQASVAIIVNLPEHCVATSTSNKGRLVLNNVTLQKIWKGEITKWSEITDNGDKVIAEKGQVCNNETAITRIVRQDKSGTSHIFKRYLALINNEKNIVGTEGWLELSTGAGNTVWPGTVLRPTEKGTGPLVKLTAETPSSISYANLADVRSNGKFSKPAEGGGPNKGRFWTPIQNDGLATSGTLTYTDPSSNKDTEKVANSNCAGTAYINGENPFPPPSLTELWNEVTSNTTEKAYTLCGLTYALSFTKYSKYTGTTEAEATTANNFLNFMLNTEKEKELNKKNGGQTLINLHDYLALPSGTMRTEAQKGVALITF
jgi:ABC-type phosphate transport system substrate-binding protein